MIFSLSCTKKYGTRYAMKTLELMACLQREELRQLESILQGHKRHALHKLFKALRNAVSTGTEPAGEVLFESIFDKPYQKTSDYLLRNELRLLNREIELFLLEKEILRRLRQDEPREIIPAIVWCELLLDRKQTELFEKEWRRWEKTAREKEDYALMHRLYLLYLTFIYRHRELHPDLYVNAAEMLEQAREFVLLDAEEHCRTVDVKRAYVYRILNAMGAGPASPFEETTLQPAASNQEKRLMQYLRIWSQTYVASDKIPLYEQLLEWQPFIARLRPELEANEFVFLNNLALLYMLERRDYRQADHFFSQAMDNYRRHHKKVHTELLFNYLSNLTRLERFAEVIELYQAHRQAAEADPKLHFKFCYLLAMNHLFVNQPEAALAYIPEDLRQRPRFEYIYTRFIFAIAYYMEGLDDLFEREVQNLYQTIRYKTPEEAGEWRYTLEVFRKFARIAAETPNAKARSKQMAALGRELEADRQAQTAGADNLILLWLKRTLG